ncbi:hypothetical protein GGF37_004292 [Kickxella alabastrina]|nr:hypothetical protein GGF37_004292 [Kickxella alabastrina]
MYQHRVEGFQLKDPKRSGCRKIFAFFFIDPTTRIPSTEVVPPQQQEWWKGEVMSIGPLRGLPLLVKNGILENVDFPISLDEAKRLRLELMEERSSHDIGIGHFFTPDFYFCEH